jgi:hypothetical protein
MLPTVNHLTLDIFIPNAYDGDTFVSTFKNRHWQVSVWLLFCISLRALFLKVHIQLKINYALEGLLLVVKNCDPQALLANQADN